MVQEKVKIGQIVSSMAGRDKEEYFIVYRRIDDKTVEVVDGKLRKVERPKKKNLKHLKCYPKVCNDIAAKIIKHERVNNAEIRGALVNSNTFN